MYVCIYIYVPSTGLTEEILRDVYGLVSRQLRVICRSHSYYTGEKNSEIFSKLAVDTPQTTLLQDINRCCEQANLHAHLQPSRVGEWHQLSRCTLLAWSPEAKERGIEPTTGASSSLVEVSSAGQEFAMLAHMHKHPAKAHRISLREDWQQHLSKDYVALCLGSMPTCFFCRHEFWGWPEFNLHVAYKQCEGLRIHYALHGEAFLMTAPAQSDHRPLLLSEEVRQKLATGSWYSIVQMPLVRETLEHHCPICPQYMLQSGYIKSHIRAKHPNLSTLLTKCEAPVKNLSFPKPCVWCGKQYSRRDTHLRHCLTPCVCMLLEGILFPDRPSAGEPSIRDVRSAAFSVPVGGSLIRGTADESYERDENVLRPSSDGGNGRHGIGASTEQWQTTEAGQERRAVRESPEEPEWPGKGEGQSKGRFPRGSEGQTGRMQSQKSELLLLQQMVASLCRLILRHEDALTLQALDTRFVIFCSNHEQGLPGKLWKVAKIWRDKKEKQQVTMSLRVTMGMYIVGEVIKRAEECLANSKEEMIQNLWLTEQESWNYLLWDSNAKTHKIDASKDPLPHRQALQDLHRLEELLPLPNVVHRLHSLRPLTETSEASVIAFVMDFEQRRLRRHTL